ncbi:MAG TPA: pitrilysin family protein [Candidatus Eisenbacteria bacterium]|nr:pitrilysin family protein [Candidatus Eisenbacteria bacterium]
MSQSPTAIRPEAVTRGSPVFEAVLDNGLKVLIQEVRGAPVVSSMVWYKVGSRNESAGVTGISHLLEHMMFKGTPKYGKGEIARLLQRNGASFNAATSLDYTNYYEILASDRLELALEIEADRMMNAVIPEEEHRLEMTVVRSELERNEDNPHRALYTELFAQAFLAHPYHWPTIGWRSDVEAIQTKQIRDHYRRYYVPNNATVVIVGDVARDQALALVRKHFGPIERGAEPPPVVTVEPRQVGERRFKIRKLGDTRYLMVAYKAPALTDPDTYALDVLGMILGNGKASRLYQALVEGNLATEAEAANETARDPLLFIAEATAAPGVPLDRLEPALLAEADRMKAEPPSQAELSRAKKQLQASFIYSRDSVRSLAQQLGYYETVGSYRYLDTYLDRIAKVASEDIQRVARGYLVEDARTIGHYDPLDAAGSRGDGRPDPDPREGPRRRPAENRYREHDTVAAPAARAPSRGAIEPLRFELPNGLVVILRENHANPTVAIQGLVKAGAIYDPPGKSGLAGLAAAMLDRGTTNRTALEQAEALESIAASLRFDAGPETATFSGTALAEDIGTVLGVLADALRNPAFAPDQIEKGRDEQIIRVKVAEENTGFVASRVANEILFPPGHPFHHSPIGTEASLGAITRDDLTSFHASYYGPNTVAFVLVGDIDPKTTIEQVTQWFGDWRKLESPAPFAVPRIAPPDRMERRIVRMEGKSQVDVVYALPGLSRIDPDYYAAMIMSYILGGGSLSSRLMDALRDKHGLVYGVYSSLNAGIGAGPIQIRAGTNPANADRTAKEIWNQVTQMHEGGPTPMELQEAKSYLTGVFPVRLETNSGVAAQLLGAELYGLGMDYIERYASIINGILLEEVRAASKKYLRPKGYALVIAGSYDPSPSAPGAE